MGCQTSTISRIQSKNNSSKTHSIIRKVNTPNINPPYPHHQSNKSPPSSKLSSTNIKVEILNPKYILRGSKTKRISVQATILPPPLNQSIITSTNLDTSSIRGSGRPNIQLPKINSFRVNRVRNKGRGSFTPRSKGKTPDIKISMKSFGKLRFEPIKKLYLPTIFQPISFKDFKIRR